MQSNNFNPAYKNYSSGNASIPLSYHRRTASFPTHQQHKPKDLYHTALERSTTLSTRTPPRPITTGAIQYSKEQAAPSYLDLQSSDYWYYYYYYNQPNMAGYRMEAPAYAGHSNYYLANPSPTHVPLSSSPRAAMPMSRSPTLPTMMPQPAIPKSYIHQTFRDFASHAYKCSCCYDPLRVHLEGRQLCSKGHKLARKVSSALYEEANEKYRRSKYNQRRPDGWQSIEVDIPEGCEIVRALLVAINRGLKIHSSTEIVPATPVTPTPRTHFDDNLYDHYHRRPSPASDEEIYSRSRSRHREDKGREGTRSRSARRSSSANAVARKPVVIGIQERERRPYGGGSHSSNNSVDSGYDTAPGSPDTFRRGSQYAEDLKRRKERPKSILKNSFPLEREHLLEREPKTPISPTKGTDQEKYVFFNIRGECLAPGYD
jgi:hypothetical protein